MLLRIVLINTYLYSVYIVCFHSQFKAWSVRNKFLRKMEAALIIQGFMKCHMQKYVYCFRKSGQWSVTNNEIDDSFLFTHSPPSCWLQMSFVTDRKNTFCKIYFFYHRHRYRRILRAVITLQSIYRASKYKKRYGKSQKNEVNRVHPRQREYLADVHISEAAVSILYDC